MLMERVAESSRRLLRRLLAATLTIHLILLFQICCPLAGGDASCHARESGPPARSCCAGEKHGRRSPVDSCHHGQGPCFCSARTIPLTATARVTVALSPAFPIDPMVGQDHLGSISDPSAAIEVLGLRPPRSRTLSGPDADRAPPENRLN